MPKQDSGSKSVSIWSELHEPEHKSAIKCLVISLAPDCQFLLVSLPLIMQSVL